MNNSKTIMRQAVTMIRIAVEMVMLPVLAIAAVLSRFTNKLIDIGLGPEPLINNIYHKKALIKYGYSAETFVNALYYITHEFDWVFVYKYRLINYFAELCCVVFFFAIFRYKALYIYFNGGPLYGTMWLWRIEPYLFQLANMKVVVMPYGGDVQDLSRCPNLLFRHAMAKDYPIYRLRRNKIAKKIDLWIANADHIIAGCDWVDYLYYWDSLMLAHFSIDVEKWPLSSFKSEPSEPLKVLHAPNHRSLKGTNYIINAIDELKEEGVAIDIILLEKVPNEKVREAMDKVDVVVDQLIIGWYAMFALEAMSMGKPVICFLREDLKRLYIDTGLVDESEIPIINCSIRTIKPTLRELANNKDKLAIVKNRSRDFVINHHSIEVVGKKFDAINRSIGIKM